MLQFLFLITDESDHEKVLYVYNRYHDEMLRIAKYRTHMMGLPNYELDAEDAVQNAFVKIMKYIDKIDFSLGEKELRAYVMAIVVNETLSIKEDYIYFDDMNEQMEIPEDEDFFSKMQIFERYEEVVGAIKKIDEKYSIVLWYRYNDNLGVKDISQLLGIPEKTVYTRLLRGRKLLIELLGEEK